MPIDYAKYPPNWKEIRARILKRAGNCCEWCGAENHKPHPITGSRVVLTVAHLDHDAENWDVKDERLAALCQRCHLNYDREYHLKKAAITRRKQKANLELFPEYLKPSHPVDG